MRELRPAMELEQEAAETAGNIHLVLGVLIVVGASLLSGATCQRRPQTPVGDAAPICYRACTPALTDTGVRWEGDPNDPEAWDDLGGRVVPELSGLLLACERSRQACTDFLESIKQRGVIRVKE